MKRADWHLVLDLGGVLFTFDHARRLRELSATCSLPPDRLHALLWTSGLSADADAGRFPSAEDFRARVRASTGFTGADDDLDLAWCSAFRPDWRVREVLNAHRGSLTLFTNNGPLEEEVLLRCYPAMFEGFGQLLFSYRLGHRKPDPAAFGAVSSRLGVGATAGEIRFVDDSHANCDVARSLGWTAYPFQGPETVEQALTAARAG
ncbi:HAD family hydrolase [Flindersiella endophytica]